MTTLIPDNELNEIEARSTAATPGPWHWDKYGLYMWGPKEEMVADSCGVNDSVRIRGSGANLPMEANAAFIEHARMDIPRLLNEVRQLRELLFADPSDHASSIFSAFQVTLNDLILISTLAGTKIDVCMDAGKEQLVQDLLFHLEGADLTIVKKPKEIA